MKVASLELSKELYELSGWQYELGTNGLWYTDLSPDLVLATYVSGDSTPAYDLGYLMRKLPRTTDIFNGEIYRLTLQRSDSGRWHAFYCDEEDADDTRLDNYLDSPEDAIAGLAIDLFAEGVVTRGGDE